MESILNAELHSQLQSSAQTLERLMEKDDRIVIMTADLATSCKLSRLAERFPERFINVGIAEQNMMSVAAGLAHEGMKPFVHTFSVFSSLRACEQIRTDVFYNDVNVKIVGTHSGLSTGVAGPTHFALEDIGVIRSMPKSRIIVPADAVSTRKFIELLANDSGPAYIRLDRNPLPDIYDDSFTAEIGRGNIVKQGEGILIAAVGAVLSQAVAAQEKLAESGIQVTVVDMPTVKPLDTALLQMLAQTHSAVITVEEHNVYGGLGSAVGQAIAELGLGMRLKCLGVQDCFPSGNPVAYNRAIMGIDCLSIANAAAEMRKYL